MEQAKQVIGLSATLGQAMSKNFIRDNWGEKCQIIDMEAVTKTPNIELKVVTQLKAVEKFSKGTILSAALSNCQE